MAKRHAASDAAGKYVCVRSGKLSPWHCNVNKVGAEKHLQMLFFALDCFCQTYWSSVVFQRGVFELST